MAISLPISNSPTFAYSEKRIIPPRILTTLHTDLQALLFSTRTAINRPSTAQELSDTRYLDGLRGLASLFVVSTHLLLCLDLRIINPCCGPDETTPLLFQRPIFRLVIAGHAWVALFLVLSGFVNGIKPLKHLKNGNIEVALGDLSLSAFRRTLRLMLPATAATLISWMAANLGFYETARKGDAHWLLTCTPGPSASWGVAIEDLVKAFKDTWALAVDNKYDQPQWVLVYFLQGSMMGYLALLITSRLTKTWRTAVLILMIGWSFDWSLKVRDPMVGLTTLSGLLLSHIHISTTIFTAITPYSSLITPTLLILSLVLMSYPFDNATSAPWSSYLTALGLKYLPRSSELVRMWASIGSILLVFSLSLSPLLRRLLSQKPLLFLGRISFPIYLLHGTMLRTIFAWVLFAGQKEVNGRYPQGPWVVKCLAVMVFLAATGGISWFWMENVEPVFARVTAAVERNVMGVGGSRPGSPRSPKRGILGEFGDRKE